MFTKGQKVTVINNWSRVDVNHKGDRTPTQFSVQHLVVHSCGKKQMILATESGEVFKRRNYEPTTQQRSKFHQVLPRMSTADALALADALTVEFNTEELAHVEERLVRYSGGTDGYVRSMEARRDYILTGTATKPAALYEELAS